ncbi:MAG: sigma-54-dependent Fis family transcriptional regulator [Bacteroidota bacterium]|jgi:DNA-binding NarL/FixJ family response regulator|nr:sigma-54-dependent Fis family transcriptional regulator [Bacteroidota bacterium]
MIAKRPKHIFIVEDNEIYSMMLDYILSKDSIYQFVSFKSGEECIENLYLNPDVIILDYGLPGMNGYETLLEVKKKNPNIHVVILSNNEDKKLRAQLLEAGADDFVMKQGHGENQIIDKIEDILSRDEMQKKTTELKKKPMAKAMYFVLVFALLALGIFITQAAKNKSHDKAGASYMYESH